MPLKSDYNHIICIMEGETKNIRFVLKIYRFVLRLLNISFCGLYYSFIDFFTSSAESPAPCAACSADKPMERRRFIAQSNLIYFSSNIECSSFWFKFVAKLRLFSQIAKCFVLFVGVQ